METAAAAPIIERAPAYLTFGDIVVFVVTCCASVVVICMNSMKEIESNRNMIFLNIRN
jgi:hypothetical protein